VNVSRSGPSLTFGVRGAHVTMGRTGIAKTVGLPGTGIYYTSHDGYHSGFHSAHGDPPLPPQDQASADRKAEATIVVLGIVIVFLIVMLIGALAK
jgi:hypothetical protein